MSDERGSITSVTDGAGAILGINRYDEYGIPAPTNIGRFQYTGQAWLPEVGLYNYKARMYSPTLGRFMQTDPIGYGDGMNWYNYVGSDPVNGRDPSGLKVTTGTGNQCAPPTEGEIVACGNPGRGGGGGGVVFYPRPRDPSDFYPGRGGRDYGGGGGGGALNPPATEEEKPRADPKCNLALSQAGNIAFEATIGSLIVGGGITGSRGTFINLQTGTTGSFFSLGGGAGADIGVAEIAGTVSSLGLLNKGGASASISAGVATFSANGSLGKGGITPAGKSAGLGYGMKIGASLTMTGTRLYGCKVRGQ